MKPSTLVPMKTDAVNRRLLLTRWALNPEERLSATSRAKSLPPDPPSGHSARRGTCTCRLSSPPARDRSTGAFPPAPETHSTKTGSGSRQTPRACSPHPKSTKPGRPHPAPPPAGSTPQHRPFSHFPSPFPEPVAEARFLGLRLLTFPKAVILK